MAAIDAEQVLKIARLARLELTADEAARFAPQIQQVLEHVEQLGRLDLANVPPMVHATELLDVVRDDTVQPGLQPADALANAPAQDGAYFRVPPVLDSQ